MKIENQQFIEGVCRMTLKHLNLLTYKKDIETNEGVPVKIFELSLTDEEDILNEWARHLREHYCADSEIDILRQGYGISRRDYLETIKFPDSKTKPGPSIRSGDFTEILVADYVQYVLNYYVPRTRYDTKTNRNSSTMGSDLLGYRVNGTPVSSDEIIIFEVKSSASATKPGEKAKLQDAVDHSDKDVIRLAESLNASVQRLLSRGDLSGVKKVQRFQNSTDTPYRTTYAAAAVQSKVSHSEDLIKAVSTINHSAPNVELLVVYCDNLMHFIHQMYRRACEC